MKNINFLLGFALICFQGYAQVIYGVNNYTQYHPGTLPIIISVPHGGSVAPETIPDRTCNNPTTVTDLKTVELARQIDTALFNLTGCHPHLIICNLKRTKIDCNRNIADGACGNSETEIAWTEFQHFIDTAQFIAQNQYSGKAFYIDLHGHGKDIQRLELGYGLSGVELNNSDNTLNTPTYISSSSIQNLVTTNINGYTHAELLRGVNALGTLLANAGFPSVPSLQTPDPGNTSYFNGGYNTFNHTCLLSGNTVNGLQIECDATVRSNYINRKNFGDSVASILINYLFIHQNIDLENCGLSTSIIENTDNSFFFDLIPNPATDIVHLFTNKIEGNYEVVIINAIGEIVFKTKNQNIIFISQLPKGIYFVQLADEQKHTCNKKIIIL